MQLAVMKDSSHKNLITTFSNPKVVGCPVKFWLLNGVLLGMAVLYASCVAPCKKADSVDLSRHIERAVEVDRVVASRSAADYGVLGTGQEEENAKPAEAGKGDQTAGTGASEGTPAASTETPTGTQTGSAADPTKDYLIYFTATWCGPCQIQKPIIEQIKAAGKHKVHIVDVDNDRASANSWGVGTVPTVAVVRDGKVVYRGTGAGHSREFLESKLEGR